jgi:hypothetical protein
MGQRLVLFGTSWGFVPSGFDGLHLVGGGGEIGGHDRSFQQPVPAFRQDPLHQKRIGNSLIFQRNTRSGICMNGGYSPFMTNDARVVWVAY